MLTPLKDDILFVFTDEVKGGMFVEKSAGGLYLGRSNDVSASLARWAKVLAVGPDVKKDGSVNVGDIVLIGPLRWTEGFHHEGVQIWKTKLPEILAIQET